MNNESIILLNYPSALCLIQIVLENYNFQMNCQHFDDIKEIPAEVKLIKCRLDGLSFDISINNFVGLVKLCFMNFLESKCENKNIFKRTLFLIKSWSYYQASILGSNLGLLSSYALEIIIIYIFNQFPDSVNNEFDALFLYFKIMSEIDWNKQVFSVFGIMSIEEYIETNYFQNQNNFDFKINKLGLQKNLITTEDLNIFMKKFECLVNCEKAILFKKKFELKLINILDPIMQYNNLGRSVNFHNFSKIKKVFEMATKESNKINLLKKEKKDLLIYLNNLFLLFDKIILFKNPLDFQSILDKPGLLFNDEDEQDLSADISDEYELSPFFKNLTTDTIDIFNTNFIHKQK